MTLSQAHEIPAGTPVQLLDGRVGYFVRIDGEDGSLRVRLPLGAWLLVPHQHIISAGDGLVTQTADAPSGRR